MRRSPARPRLILLALIAVALVFLLVPASYSLALRSQLLSFLQPVLALFQPTPGSAPELMRTTAPAATGARVQPAPGGDSIETDRLRSDLIRLQEENLRLRAMLGVAAPPSGQRLPRGVTSGVIAREVLWQDPVLGLDRGTNDGVRPGAAVLFRGVAVGRIVSVGPRAACLALTTNRGVCVAARLAECRAEGVLKGARDAGAERLCRMTLITPDLQARVGEHVVTSGLDGSFPPGCWLGDVAAIEQKGNLEWDLTVRPACETARLEAVYILTDPPPPVPWPPAPVGRRP